ncbi:MAG: protein translocase subunit SecD [Gammaproteobacteria bacterium]|nr:protein translocase subunit SecD [Gammaproteobacteria bacterium]MCZ6911889.1 protein translocase subunit SecD [Pseudomonadota bacterium]
MNRYPAWKNILVVAVIVFGTLLALPNSYGEDPALQIAPDKREPMGELGLNRAKGFLDEAGVDFAAAYLEQDRVVVRFADVDLQIQAAAVLGEQFGENFVVALTTEPRTPEWMRSLGLQPMSLGLDLRGGVYFLYEVDLKGAISQTLERYRSDFRAMLRDGKIPYRSIEVSGDIVSVTLRNPEDLNAVNILLRNYDAQLALSDGRVGGQTVIRVGMNTNLVKQRQDFAIQQNITTLRNRVNELGVAEPLVQRQGLSRIVVQLPGVQDPAQAKIVLGATATVDFRLVDQDSNPYEAQRRGRPPLGSKLYFQRDGTPVLLKRDVIVTGDQLTDATSGFSQGQPAVFVKLDAKGARRMLDTTRSNLKKPMAVVFIEQVCDELGPGKSGCLRSSTREEVISVATIQGVFSSNFQITGLTPIESRDLALLLRAGSLAAPIFIVEERTIGPSLGQDNIDQGFQAVKIGFLAVVVFMLIYYRVFGMVANLALFANLVLVVALLSLLQAVLTLPGIAGIVLTVGMAVDANVLIFERIREELRNRNSPQASIAAGYDKAFSSIIDANVTTLIAAVVLFTFGTGAIRGFAVTLSLGILTSMFTAIVGTRALINLIYGRRQHLETLSI